MKRIVKEVVVRSFSETPIPVGALFDDDSPYLALMDPDAYEDVDKPPVPRKVGAVRKTAVAPIEAPIEADEEGD